MKLGFGNVQEVAPVLKSSQFITPLTLQELKSWLKAVAPTN